MDELIDLLEFAINNEDKFTEFDPDHVKHKWIEDAKKAVKKYKDDATECDLCFRPATVHYHYCETCDSLPPRRP